MTPKRSKLFHTFPPFFDQRRSKTKNKFNVSAAPRFNQIRIPSQNDLCEFLLINLLHQRLMLFLTRLCSMNKAPRIPFPPQEFFAVKFSSKYKKRFSYKNIFVAISLNSILSSPIMALDIVQ